MRKPHSPERRALLDHVLSREEVTHAEYLCPGVIAVHMITGNRAHLTVMEYIFVFTLFVDKGDEHESLGVESDDIDLEFFKETFPSMWSYAFHRAAEAILAVRNGYKSSREGRRNHRSARDRKFAPVEAYEEEGDTH